MNVTDSNILDTTNDYIYSESTETFENSRTFTFHFLPVLYCLAFTFGLVGNILVIFVLVYCKKLRTTTDVYLFNMAVSDLLFVVSLPFIAYTIINEWIFGNIMCKILSTIYFVGFFSSIFFITVMSVDRYFAIVHVVFALRVRNVRWGLIVSIVVWVLALSISTPNFKFHEIVMTGNYTECVLSYPEINRQNWKIFCSLLINIFGLVIPLFILLFSYLHIIKTLQNSKCKQKRCAIRLILIVGIVFFIFWTPYNIVVFLNILKTSGAVDLETDQLQTAADVTHTLSLVHCCLNPIIYTFAGEKFRGYLRLIINRPLNFVHSSRIVGSYKTSVSDYASSTSRISKGSFSSESIL
ncbi:hypothetical protein XENTR_v10008636 [Xenopus tropicalis]|uniref:C-C chemokine receptor type 4 n=1 Tax=Xenopus tropicalis TaxID=8364 RepID=A0A6I8R4J8_XENTR|nr:C-C chemokine receptor type 4 [Xenopus tropicalis]KAE8615842.1 hypothetical protein XENTR_v10008636 [Xenopus tropicalis]|eukprot:XP_017947772.1 PREDICTED: C-C chemokine receptor type 4-like [Xenopus tropicalis]